MSRRIWENQDFNDDLLLDRDAKRSRWSWIFLVFALALFVTGIVWAKYAELEEVTRGEGRIIPSGKIQIVQSLEGGIVESIDVVVGQRVAKGDILLTIDDTTSSASLGELDARKNALNGKIARLEAEMAGRGSVNYSDELKAVAPDVIATENRLFSMRRSNVANNNQVLRSRKEQREQEKQELNSNIANLQNQLQIARDDLALNEKISDIVPQSELLKLRKEVSRLSGEIETTRSSIMRAEAAVREASGLLSTERSNFRQEAQAELTDARADLSVLVAGSKAAGDRVERADVRSPVDGIINEIHINTLGGVIQPGRDLVEIVPFGKNLLVEARIRPQDIAFLSTAQEARVKITAYDYSIYGGLNGTVERIGADSVTDEVTGETYFPIDIRADASDFKKDNENLPVTPGMVASVDIITGHKSVLQYLLKPVNKARYEGLRER
jgi:adhesin transport system membrane fusion protein